MILSLTKFAIIFLALLTLVLFIYMLVVQIVNTFAFHVEEDKKSAAWRFIMMLLTTLFWSIYITWLN